MRRLGPESLRIALRARRLSGSGLFWRPWTHPLGLFRHFAPARQHCNSCHCRAALHDLHQRPSRLHDLRPARGQPATKAYPRQAFRTHACPSHHRTDVLDSRHSSDDLPRPRQTGFFGVDITAPSPLALYLPPLESAALREVLERPNSHARFRVDAHSPFQLHRSNVAATRTTALCIVSVTDLLLSG